ncbi:2-amino-4-hydroxy-6-hydroxymethyldihydropteridine diphosphokinase [Amphibacillus cookii]|uniref:2-amino-4-hydroxy-6- hydroxymethyldihydropteridine diphosphokinase n=1 Tax=Amphibacillus cookii TaxID=767787 RepID=UPI001956E4A3|nr:2-amino-4-hydroxy-6-hydroxymethyldihydropteridine diphosphokinase [Amphibacillus cookii]MBM7543177.1 2-amino-4-hydroxy-6-hydroxymethyldihydropteridine diphosphokinase [Amphibacillus cookii]
MNKAYVALGSNIAPRHFHLTQAIDYMKRSEHVLINNYSSIYQTVPIGYQDQGEFLNMVVEVSTTLSSTELLDLCQTIEADLGRKREIKWGPRTIDLDILLYNQDNMVTEQLILPHPRMHKRAFVLVPLAELNPELRIPGTNESVKEHLAQISNEEKRGVVKWTKQDGEEE